jgi:hypothetical protein
MHTPISFARSTVSGVPGHAAGERLHRIAEDFTSPSRRAFIPPGRFLLPIVMLLSSPVIARASVTTLNPVADTDTQSDVAAGTNAVINFSLWNTALFKFDLASISGTVTAAKLRVYLPNAISATTISVLATSNDTWTEGSAKPDQGSTITTQSIPASNGGYIEIDLTSHVQTKLAGNKIVSVGLIDTLNNWVNINSRQSATNKPELVVTTGASGSSLSASADTDQQSDVAAGTNTNINFSLWNAALFKFDLSSLTGSISSATLRLYLPWGMPATTVTVMVTSNDTWVEGGTKPATGSTITTKSVGTLAAGWLEIDLTAHAQSKLAGDKIVSVALINTLNNWVGISSRQAASNQPQLVVNGGGTGGTVSRPSYNTGNGLFVLNGKLYDQNGVEFHIRGVNKLHWDAPISGMFNSNSNAVRWVIDFNQPTATNINLMQQTINAHVVPIPGNWDGTCGNDSALTAIVDKWVAQATAWTPLNRYMILNIANELGSANSTAWRDAYITAVTRLRNAGYLCPIMVDAGGCGQDPDDLLNYASAILNSDPQKNIIFDQHIYGGWGSLLAIKSVGALSAGYVDIDLTAYVQSVMSGSKVASIGVGNTLPNWVGINSRQAASNPPQLVVTASGTTTLTSVADTDIQSDVAAGTNPQINFSSANIAFFKFNLASVSGSVSSATLRLYLPGGIAATTIKVAAATNDTWVEGGAKPDASPYVSDLTSTFDALAATGLCIVIGEFGPGRNIGPSPTTLTPGQIITASDARNFGWMAWAWDDPAYNADDTWFALSYTGAYSSSADLTIYGKDVVENSTYGIKNHAVKQTGF